MKILLVSRLSIHLDTKQAFFKKEYNKKIINRTFVNHWGWYWMKALEELGHIVIPFPFNQSLILNRHLNLSNEFLYDLFNRVSERSNWNKIECFFTNQGLIRATKNYRPDLLFIDTGETICPETLRTIAEMKERPIIINWLLDDPFRNPNWGNVIRGLPFYDYLFVFDPYYIGPLKGAGAKDVRYLPLACDPDIHRKFNLDTKEMAKLNTEVCFAGTLTSKRVQLFNELNGFDLGLWGWHTKILKKYPTVKRFYRGKAFGEMLSKVFSYSKIVLNIHHEQSVLGVNLRTFEAAGCKAFQLVDYIKEIQSLFTIGEEIITYKSYRELKEKIIYYLKHENEMEEIAQNAQKRAYGEHTYSHRMNLILETISTKV